MPKDILPVYHICSLSESSPASDDFMTDRLANYLDTHRDLHFPHKHSFYHLVYFTAGSGKHAIDFVPFAVRTGQLYCMIPGQVHDWEFDAGVDGYVVHFSASYLHRFISDVHYVAQFSFFSGIVSEQVLDIPEDKRSGLTKLFESIIKEGNGEEAFADDMARLSLVELFIYIARNTTGSLPTQANNYSSILLRNFQKLIELHYKNKKLTKEYAVMLYVTPNHLNALCKDLTGRPAGELIRDRVILEAKRLLINADITITAISDELEFTDNSYFTKFFKKYTGTGPEAFRKQFANKKFSI